jgi:hypothetical protein
MFASDIFEEVVQINFLGLDELQLPICRDQKGVGDIIETVINARASPLAHPVKPEMTASLGHK